MKKMFTHRDDQWFSGCCSKPFAPQNPAFKIDHVQTNPWEISSSNMSTFLAPNLRVPTAKIGIIWYFTKNFRYLKWRNPEPYFRLFWGWENSLT